jgi:ribonuclease VapC
MIIDTSAIIAVLFNEADAQIYALAITRADARRISAATFVETAIASADQKQRRPPARRLHASGRHRD